ncbi:SsrA-binding protein [Haloferula sp. A504]|uniref:SsrA-binding protein n=1 Tax=Haloferula sp. A504 TaxID=3373601 RepID=UPI0031C9EE42|nr:SsrA-binding protein [Verrucomicrobiaceae bacterium E54]
MSRVLGRAKRADFGRKELKSKGSTLPCQRMYWKNRRVKVEIGVGKGKSHRDQRHDLKKKVELREAQREVARFNRQ